MFLMFLLRSKAVKRRELEQHFENLTWPHKLSSSGPTGSSLQVAGLRAEAKEREERMSKLEKKIRDATKR